MMEEFSAYIARTMMNVIEGNTTGNAPTLQSTLTAEKLREMIDSLPAEPRYDFFGRPFPMKLAGMNILEAPPPPPKLQVRDIKFRDGTSILSGEFRAKVNADLLERFGYQEDLFKDRAFILGSYGIVMNSHWRHHLVNLACG
jgi:hypothetical protein